MFNSNFFEQGFDLVPDSVFADANADVSGDWVDLSNYERAYALVAKGAGVAGDDLQLTINQATDNAGTGSKGLTVSKLWYKVGTLSSVGTWSSLELATAASTLDLSNLEGTDLQFDTNAGVVLIEAMVDQLDVTNGFRYVQLFSEGDAIATASTNIFTAWILAGSHYPQPTPLNPLD